MLLNEIDPLLQLQLTKKKTTLETFNEFQTSDALNILCVAS